MDHHPNDLGPTIRDAAAAAGISIRQLARDSGVPRETLNRRIAGSSDFTLGELFRVAAAVGASPTEWVRHIEESAEVAA